MFQVTGSGTATGNVAALDRRLFGAVLFDLGVALPVSAMGDRKNESTNGSAAG